MDYAPHATSPTPWPLDAAVSPVLLFGGSFDPPHLGHATLATGARDALGPGAGLVFVPAARSPHKARGPIAPGATRAALLDLVIAAQGIARAAVWTDEIDRAEGVPADDAQPAPSYWVDTLERTRAVVGDGIELRFLLGADQTLAFHRWREPRRILELARPLVVLRAPIDTPAMLRTNLVKTNFWSDTELDAWADACVAGLPLIDASSTAIRAALARGEKESEIAPMTGRDLAQRLVMLRGAEGVYAAEDDVES